VQLVGQTRAVRDHQTGGPDGRAEGRPDGGHEREDSLVRGLLTGIATFRWLAWAWMATLLVVSRPELGDDRARPWLAIALVGAALATTTALTVLLRTDAARLLALPVVAAEIAVAFAVEAGDKVVYNGVAHPQSLSSAWPLAAIMTAGIAFGAARIDGAAALATTTTTTTATATTSPANSVARARVASAVRAYPLGFSAARGGMVAGVAVGLGRVAGEIVDPTRWSHRDSVSSVSTLVLYALAGGVAGFVTVRLREAERRISLAQAREEIARTLHDGVLQTLAIVQRRAGDADIVRLAHDQERELREYLFGTPRAVGGGGDLGSRLRAAAARFEDRYAGTARVIVADDVPALPPAAVEAVAGAVGEALANAGKHGAAGTVTVFAEPSDGTVFCSVKDDGRGFDPATTSEGEGLRRSVRARIAEVGGRVEIDGRPGRGTEVRCWVPA
jgi:signal transduction histidine kinase